VVVVSVANVVGVSRVEDGLLKLTDEGDRVSGNSIRDSVESDTAASRVDGEGDSTADMVWGCHISSSARTNELVSRLRAASFWKCVLIAIMEGCLCDCL